MPLPYTLSKNMERALHIDLNDREIRLADNAPLRIGGGRGVIVRCTAGRIWLTTAGEHGDVFLAAGQSHTLASNRLVLVEAIRHGSVRLEIPPGRRVGLPWRRLGGILAASHALRITRC